MYIDIHCHYNSSDSGIIKIANLVPQDKLKAVDNVWYSIGLHPWEAKEWNIQVYNLLKERMLNDRVIAIGEIGLDRVFDVSFNVQLSVFECQLDIAHTLKKPVIIHSVKAYADVLGIMKRYPQVSCYIMHNFGANWQTAKQYLDKNVCFSFGKLFMQGHEKTVETFKKLPLESIFFETDVNNFSIRDIYELGAELRGIKIEELKEQIEQNFISCFGDGRKFGLG